MRSCITISLLGLLLGSFAEAGTKTHWTVEVHGVYENPTPATLIQSTQMIVSFPSNGVPVYLDGPTNLALFPKGGNAAESSGNFAVQVTDGNLKSGQYEFGAWDRTFGTGDAYRATFETVSRIHLGEAQRIFFTQGDATTTHFYQYLVLIKLDQAEACDDSTTCLKK